MKFQITKNVELDDYKILSLADAFEGQLTEAIHEIEENQMQDLMDLIGGVMPIDSDDDETMELAFDLISDVQSKILKNVMARWNWVQSK